MPFVFSLEASPVSLEFKGEAGEEFCENISIVDFDSELVVEDKWAGEGYTGRDLTEHELSGDDVKVDLDFNFLGDGISEVCLKGKRGGVYHGVLLIRERDENAGIGIWIELELEKRDVISFNGMSLVDSVKGEVNTLSFALTALFIFLFIILLLLLKFV